MRKLCARWVARQLGPKHLESWIEFCQYMLKKFDDGWSEYVSNIPTGDETWIYFYVPETKQQSWQWVADGEDVPVKFMRKKSAGKVMVAIFFRRSWKRGLQWMLTGMSTLVWHKFYSKWRNLDLVLAPRTCSCIMTMHLLTKDYVSTSGFHQLPHPAYSPVLAPCDYFLFPKIKKELKGKVFQSREELMKALDVQLEKVTTAADLKQCFSAWFNRMKKCIQQSGGYFEKL